MAYVMDEWCSIARYRLSSLAHYYDCMQNFKSQGLENCIQEFNNQKGRTIASFLNNIPSVNSNGTGAWDKQYTNLSSSSYNGKTYSLFLEDKNLSFATVNLKIQEVNYLQSIFDKLNNSSKIVEISSRPNKSYKDTILDYLTAADAFDNASPEEQLQKAEDLKGYCVAVKDIVQHLLDGKTRSGTTIYATNFDSINTQSTNSALKSVQAYFKQLYNNISKVEGACDASVARYQAQVFIAELNKLEIAYKNWRSDAIEYQSMKDALERFQTENTNEYESTKKIQDNIVKPVITYVNNYENAMSLSAKYVRDNGSNTDVISQLQAIEGLHGSWMTNEVEYESLKATLKNLGTNYQNDTNYQNISNYIDKFGTKNWVRDTSIIPARCTIETVGTIDDFTGLSSGSVKSAQYTLETEILQTVCAIDEYKSFCAPNQEAIPLTNWKNAEVLMNSLRSIGESTLSSYIQEQKEGLINFVNKKDQNGFYKIYEITQEIYDYIKNYYDKYRNTHETDYLNTALALVEWYNQIIDYAAQFIAIDMQKYVNLKAAGVIQDSTWNIVPIVKLSDDTCESIWTLGDDSNLLKLSLIKNEEDDEYDIKFIDYKTITEQLDNVKKIEKLYSNYIKTNSVSNINYSSLENYQSALLQLLTQYNALTEDEKNTYNPEKIKNAILQFKEYVQNNIYSWTYNKTDKLWEFNTSSNIVNNLPEDTKTIYAKLIESLENLVNAFEAAQVDKVIGRFYRWFQNIEQVYPDWRINSVSRNNLKDQLTSMKCVSYSMQIPPELPEGETITARKVEMRNSDKMCSFMLTMNDIIDKLRTTINKGAWDENSVYPNYYTVQNGSVKYIEHSSQTDSRFSDALKKAKEFLDAAQNGNPPEFFSLDDYNACNNLYTEVKAVYDSMSDKNNKWYEKKEDWKSALSGGTFSLVMSDALGNYYSETVKNHIDDLITYIEKYDIELSSNKYDTDSKNIWMQMAAVYGYTGDCDYDQVAIMKLMEKMRLAIEEEYSTLKDAEGNYTEENRGSTLLSSQVSGENVNYVVKDIEKDTDRYNRYYQSWNDFQRYSSWLVCNYLIESDKYIKRGKGKGVKISESGGKNTIENMRELSSTDTLLDLYRKRDTIVETVFKKDDTGKVYGYPEVLVDYKKTNSDTDGISEFSELFTQIDLDSDKNDFKADIMKIYYDLFLDTTTSTFQNIRKYCEGQRAFNAINEYIEYLFDNYSDWRGNESSRAELKKELAILKGSKLYEDENLNWTIFADRRLSDEIKEEASKNKINDDKAGYYGCKIGQVDQVKAVITIGSDDASLQYGAGEDESYSMADYIDFLLNRVNSYNANLDSSAIWEKRRNQISDVISEELGNSQDYSALFGALKSTLMPGGAKIADKSKLSDLIVALENLLQTWNREDESVYLSVISSLNPRGVFLLEDGVFVKQTSNTAPKTGTVKTITDSTTTITVYKDGAVESSSIVPTVEVKILTNELIAALDQLKDIYANDDAYVYSKESYYRLQMAEYLYATAGNKIKDLKWHSLVSNGEETSKAIATGTIRKNTGCYTFKLENTDQSVSYICGYVDDGIKVAVIPSDKSSTNGTIEEFVNTLTVDSFKKTKADDTTNTFYKDVEGVYYAVDANGKITDTELSLEITNENNITVKYYTDAGNIYDESGHECTVDVDGFIKNADGNRLVRKNGDGYIAYRLDVLSDRILGVEYDNVNQVEVARENGMGIYEEYSPFFSAHLGLFSAQAQYLFDEDLKKEFYNEVAEIGIDFGLKLDKWKSTSLSNATTSLDSVKEPMRIKLNEYSRFLSVLVNNISLHDADRYKDWWAYQKEAYMLNNVNKNLKSLSADGDMSNFANLSDKAKKLNDLIYDITLAKYQGDIEEAKNLYNSYRTVKIEYENAKGNASNGKGNFDAYVTSINKDFKEEKESLMYNLSVSGEGDEESVKLIAAYTFAERKSNVVNELQLLTKSVELMAQYIENYMDNNGTTKDFYNLWSLMSSGNSLYAKDPIYSRAKVWEINKRMSRNTYQGWRGDSEDASLYQSALINLRTNTYFNNSEEVNLVESTGVQNYLDTMNERLTPYIEQIKKYEQYEGLLKDSYYFQIEEGHRLCDIGGLGLESILAKYKNWYLYKAQQEKLLTELRELASNLERVIRCYDTNGVWANQMDPSLLQKIKSFSTYIGSGNSTSSVTFIGKVASFETYDSSQMSRDAYLYQIQSKEIEEIEEDFEGGELTFDEYKQKIDNLSLRDGPLDDYITSLREYLSYKLNLTEYHNSLMDLEPIEYVYSGGWKTVAESGMTDAEIEDAGGIYYRLIYGYDKNGNVVYIENYDPNDSITEASYIHKDALWHGDYDHYGIIYRVMAILYEKFTIQRNALNSLLEEIRLNNEKIAEANKILAKINRVQAQASKQGSNAQVVIPVSVIMYFQEKGIEMPTDYFSDLQDLAVYEASDFAQRMDYISNNNMNISMLLSYVVQGQLGATDNEQTHIFPGDLTDRDLLEMGSLRFIKDRVHEINTCEGKFNDGHFGHYFAYGDRYDWENKKTADNLLQSYWKNRVQLKNKFPNVSLSKNLKYFTEGLFTKMKGGHTPSAYPDSGVCENNQDSQRLELKNHAPAVASFGSCGHLHFIAGYMGDAAGSNTGAFEDEQHKYVICLMDVFSHGKYYARGAGGMLNTENFVEPDYDYNAILFMAKMEAFMDVYGDEVGQIAMQYLVGTTSNQSSHGVAAFNDLVAEHKDTKIAIDAQTCATLLDDLTNPNRGEKNLKVYTEEEVLAIKAYIDPDALVNIESTSTFQPTTSYSEIPAYKKYPLMHLWTGNKSDGNNDIKEVLNKLYGDGNSGLNADEVSLWSETLRTHIDQLNTDGQTLSTKMQRAMQRCNETTSLATQLLRGMGDMLKQLTANIR